VLWVARAFGGQLLEEQRKQSSEFADDRTCPALPVLPRAARRGWCRIASKAWRSTEEEARGSWSAPGWRWELEVGVRGAEELLECCALVSDGGSW